MLGEERLFKLVGSMPRWSGTHSESLAVHGTPKKAAATNSLKVKRLESRDGARELKEFNAKPVHRTARIVLCHHAVFESVRYL